MTSLQPSTGSAGHCRQCEGPLAHDQRYCLSCGARRGPLPTAIAVALGELQNSRARPGSPSALADAAPSNRQPEPEPDRLRELIPMARGAAVSLLLMIAFGSLIGAATSSGGVTSLAHTIVVAFAPRSQPAAALASTGAGGGSGAGGASSGGGGRASGGSGGGGGGASGSAAPLTARTVTEPDTTTPADSGGSGTTTTTSSTSATSTLPAIKHVFEIVLSGQGYQQSFGVTQGHPYLSRTLTSQGELVIDYDAVATSPLANEVALISGQGPTPQTIDDCPTFADLTPGRTGKLGQALGTGCVYPSATETLAQQLQIDGLRWRAYIQGIGGAAPSTTTTGTTTTSTPTGTTTGQATATPGTTTTGATPTTAPTAAAPDATTTSASTTGTSTSGASTTTAPVTDTSTADSCPHPAEGAVDPSQAVTATDDYATWKNPFVYFHSVLDSTTCAKDDVGLAQLATDLKTESSTPAFSYIAPDPCDDGSDTPCRPDAKAGLGPADTFLKTVVPEIERSPAYRANGLILITFDEAPQSGPDWSTASCCDQPTFPNLTATSTTPTSPTTSTPTTAPSSPTTPTSTAAPSTPTSTSTTTSASGCPTTTTPTTSSTTTPTTPSTPPSTTTTSTTPALCTPAITGDPPGGGQVGLLLISPYVKAGSVDRFDTFNHFSLLKTVEDLFGLTPLGYAADAQVPALGASLFESSR